MRCDIETKQSMPRLIKYLLFATGIVGLAATLFISVIVDAIRDHRVTWESALHLVGCISTTEAQTTDELKKISEYIIVHYDRPQIAPPGILKDLLAPGVTPEDDFGPFAPRVLAGFDPWGSQYVYERRLVGSDDRFNVYEITIRSKGANRRDEYGGGDDIQRKTPSLVTARRK